MLVDKESTQIRLIDFGPARRTTAGDSTKVLCGTPEFISPEVISYEEVCRFSFLFLSKIIFEKKNYGQRVFHWNLNYSGPALIDAEEMSAPKMD